MLVKELDSGTVTLRAECPGPVSPLMSEERGTRILGRTVGNFHLGSQARTPGDSAVGHLLCTIEVNEEPVVLIRRWDVRQDEWLNIRDTTLREEGTGGRVETKVRRVWTVVRVNRLDNRRGEFVGTHDTDAARLAELHTVVILEASHLVECFDEVVGRERLVRGTRTERVCLVADTALTSWVSFREQRDAVATREVGRAEAERKHPLDFFVPVLIESLDRVVDSRGKFHRLLGGLRLLEEVHRLFREGKKRRELIQAKRHWISLVAIIVGVGLAFEGQNTTAWTGDRRSFRFWDIWGVFTEQFETGDLIVFVQFRRLEQSAYRGVNGL